MSSPIIVFRQDCSMRSLKKQDMYAFSIFHP